MTAHLRRQWMGALALLLALTGGTAYALEGSNTVFSDDIVAGNVRATDLATGSVVPAKLGSDSVHSAKIADGAIRANDLATNSVSRQKLRNNSVNTPEIADGAVTAAELDGVGFLQAQTANLQDTTPGGASDSEQLFEVGRVRLNAFCNANENGTLTAGLTPAVDEAGPLLVTETEKIALQPFDVQFVVIVGDDAALDGAQTSFAILDADGGSATGVAAASVDPATGKCVVSIQALG